LLTFAGVYNTSLTQVLCVDLESNANLTLYQVLLTAPTRVTQLGGATNAIMEPVEMEKPEI
jgi:hypothetical protein